MASSSRETRKSEAGRYCYDTLPDSLVDLLVREVYGSPITLHAALTDQQETFLLLSELAGNRFTEAQRITWANQLWQWKASSEGKVQRSIGRVVGMSAEDRAGESFVKLAELAKKNMLTHIQQTIQAVCIQTHWRARSGSITGKPEDQLGRDSLEARERKKWIQKAADILIEANLPSVAQAKLAQNPQAALERTFGGKRARTLRNRVRTWCKVRLWLSCVHQVQWPTGVVQMLDYLDDLARGRCGKSVPGSIAATLSFFEKAGGISMSKRISTDSIFTGAVEAITMEAQVGNTGAKKAPSLFISMIISLELDVLDASRSRYKRCLVWVRLIRNWTAA